MLYHYGNFEESRPRPNNLGNCYPNISSAISLHHCCAEHAWEMFEEINLTGITVRWDGRTLLTSEKKIVERLPMGNTCDGLLISKQAMRYIPYLKNRIQRAAQIMLIGDYRTGVYHQNRKWKNNTFIFLIAIGL